ncbi:amidohydrolase family protein [Oceanicella sp. SM1341]|uniref:amidohydrolase family protein n=1 Tax=Oceanicella sp. SM1341 TaxID=1548889 RepID=UPI000E4C02D8|nr:amidohydrolase family protein [Oceanicella sp. SM1341]
MQAETTVLRDCGWIISWNAAEARHEYMQGGDVAFRGDRVLQVGGRYEGAFEHEVDARERLVMPGFVDLHAHPTFETMLKGLTDEVGSPNFYQSSLYEFLFLFELDEDGMRASNEVALSELLLSGVTSLCDISVPHEGWLDTMARSGIRGFAAPMFRSGRWFTRNGHSVEYEFDEPQGRSRLEKALAVVDEARAHPSGRLDGVVSPAQIDTCSEELLRDAAAEARARNMPIQIHASQSVVEFNEIMRRHGRTPAGWLGDLGLLGPDLTIGHGIFMDHHEWVAWSTRNDLGLLAESGTTVAHCPTVFVRRGISLRHFAEYRAAGVNMGIGTDTFPHNFVEEMRNAIYVGRTVSGNSKGPTAQMVFEAATVGGAKALGRDDIGRLAPGAKADIVLVDLMHPAMRPVRDPLRSLIFSAGDRPIRDVYVDGRQVVSAGKVTGLDREAALARVEEAQARSAAQVHKYDWAGRPADEVMPHALPFAKARAAAPAPAGEAEAEA